jgi:hypothetical protein
MSKTAVFCCGGIMKSRDLQQITVFLGEVAMLKRETVGLAYLAALPLKPSQNVPDIFIACSNSTRASIPLLLPHASCNSGLRWAMN